MDCSPPMSSPPSPPYGLTRLLSDSSSSSSGSDSEVVARSHAPVSVTGKLTIAAMIVGVAMSVWVAASGGAFTNNLRSGAEVQAGRPAMAGAKTLLEPEQAAPAHPEEEAGARGGLALLGTTRKQGMLETLGTEIASVAQRKIGIGLLQGTVQEAPRTQSVSGAGDTLHDSDPAEAAALEPDLKDAGLENTWAWHWSLPCWYHCNSSAGLCEDYCGPLKSCCKYGDLSDPPACHGVQTWPVLTHHTCVTGSVQKALRAVRGETRTQDTAPLHKFYVYRAQSGESKFPFGNVNAGNLPGVMWYLTNEVLGLSHCPKRYGIDKILRFIVTTRSTPELFKRGMNFGVRYSYDAGQCTGSNTVNLGSCDLTWKRFGHVVGCNSFKSHYPWPRDDTHYPDGIWYDFPGEGKCNSPTGSWNCTWSAEPAGEVSIDEELEARVPGTQYCCDGQCTDFWEHPHSTEQCSDRVEKVLRAFKRKYPGLPKSLPPPTCDFDRSQFWADWRSV